MNEFKIYNNDKQRIPVNLFINSALQKEYYPLVLDDLYDL